MALKKNTCYYCFKQSRRTKNPDKKIHFAKLVDHYESAHAKEALIKQLMNIPKPKYKKANQKIQISEDENKY